MRSIPVTALATCLAAGCVASDEPNPVTEESAIQPLTATGPAFTENYVFTTSIAYSGNLGGLAGADAECQRRADAGTLTAPLGRRWVALVSTGSVHARDRVEWAGGPLENVLGEIVRDDVQLSGGVYAPFPSASAAAWPWPGLAAGIDLNERGQPVSSDDVWTGSSTLGGYAAGTGTCSGWTTSSSTITGRHGDAANRTAGGGWLDSKANASCGSYKRLLCVSQAGATGAVHLKTVGQVDSASAYAMWTDGTFASSCAEYASPPAGKSYEGATGSGIYALQRAEGAWRTYCDMDEVRAARSCKEIKDRAPQAPSGDYYVQPPSGEDLYRVTCDMTTDGGGWQRMLSYDRAAGTNPQLQWAVPNSATTWGHSYLGDLGYTVDDVADVRFWCTSDSPGRTLHFRTSSYDVRLAAVEGGSSLSNASWLGADDFDAAAGNSAAGGDVAPVLLSGHNAYLPAAADLQFNATDSAFTEVPIATVDYTTTNGRRWDIRRGSGMWLCDNYRSTSQSQLYRTQHQIWFRGSVQIVDTPAGRRWSDGSVAPTCRDYRSPSGNKRYAGATGTGMYLIGTTGAATRSALCDMTASPPAAIQEVTGTIFARYASRGTELGAPTGAAIALPDGAAMQPFERGHVYQGPGSAAYAVDGEMLTTYLAAGGAGVIGYPSASQGAAAQQFGIADLEQVDGDMRFEFMPPFGPAPRWETAEVGYLEWVYDGAVHDEPPADARTPVESRSGDFVRLHWKNMSNPSANMTFTVFRRVEPATTWEAVAQLPGDAVVYDYLDTGPTNNARNCYRLRLTKGSATQDSAEYCVYTLDDSVPGRSAPRGVGRAQIELCVPSIYQHTSPVSGDSPVAVVLRLNPGRYNVTYLDSTEADFALRTVERCQTYDLRTAGITDVADILGINLHLRGTEGHVRFTRMMLLLDNVPVFEKSWGTPFGRIAGDTAGGAQLTIGFEELRDQPNWQAIYDADSTNFIGFRAQDMRTKLDSIMGHTSILKGARLDDGQGTSLLKGGLQTDQTRLRVIQHIRNDSGVCAASYTLQLHAERMDGTPADPVYNGPQRDHYRTYMTIEDGSVSCNGGGFLGWLGDVANFFGAGPVAAKEREIEHALASMGQTAVSSPIASYHFCFPVAADGHFGNAEYDNGGLTLCRD